MKNILKAIFFSLAIASFVGLLIYLVITILITFLNAVVYFFIHFGLYFFILVASVVINGLLYTLLCNNKSSLKAIDK